MRYAKSLYRSKRAAKEAKGEADGPLRAMRNKSERPAMPAPATVKMPRVLAIPEQNFLAEIARTYVLALEHVEFHVRRLAAASAAGTGPKHYSRVLDVTRALRENFKVTLREPGAPATPLTAPEGQ